MYIGPWQEYRLSRYNSDARGVKEVANDELRREMQKALEQSLHPDLAAQALQALKPVLEKEKKREPLPQIHIPRRQHQHRHHRRHRPSQAHHLPSLRRADISPAPPSHRSTMSEPVQGTRLLFTPDTQPPRVHTSSKDNDVAARPSNYNPTHVANILKLERNAKRNDFSQFWQWKDDTTRKPVRPQVESKVEQIKRLHDAFREAVSKENEVETPRNRIQLSPIRGVDAPASPIMVDRDLTEKDLAAVSKYFPVQNSNTIAPTNGLHGVTMKISPRTHIPSPHSSPRASPRHKQDSILSPRLDFSPRIESTNEDDVLNMSDDGLLKWTSTLNMQDIDSMY